MLVHMLDKGHDDHEQNFIDKASDGWGGVEMPVQQPMEPRSIQAQATYDATPHAGEGVSKEILEGDNKETTQLNRMGLNTAIAISIHNFPEGLATFVATL